MIDIAMKQMESTQQQFKSLVANCLLQKIADINVSNYKLSVQGT